MLLLTDTASDSQAVYPAPGQPLRTRDAERSQGAILDAALQEFATSGLGGARMESIAARANVNKRLLYYYFASKEALFLAVLEHCYAHIRDAEQRLRLEDLQPPAAVRRLIAFTWNYYLANPHFLVLLNSENLHRARHLQHSSRIEELNSPLVAMLDQVVRRGQQQRLFRDGVDAVQLYISIAGLCYFYLSNNATLSTVFGRDLHAPEALAERLSHISDVVMGYLERR